MSDGTIFLLAFIPMVGLIVWVIVRMAGEFKKREKSETLSALTLGVSRGSIARGRNLSWGNAFSVTLIGLFGILFDQSAPAVLPATITWPSYALFVVGIYMFYRLMTKK